MSTWPYPTLFFPPVNGNFYMAAVGVFLVGSWLLRRVVESYLRLFNTSPDMALSNLL